MGGGAAALQKDVPWRASSGAKPIPKIHYSPVLRIPQNPLSDYALSIMKVWPIEVDLKFMEPVGRELKSVGKFMDSAVDLMNKSFIDR
uniref:Uncharacterized protein n=1 Tax=Solanum tuberosum TaxID=4113 RepID=M1CQR9_SOLTU